MPTSAPARPFTGRHMLALMIGFFSVVIGVNVFMAVSSSRTWTGLVVENSYVASQEFQQKLDLQREQTALGWTPDFAYRPGRLSFALRDAAGTPLDITGVTVTLTRPVGAAEDQVVTLLREPDGAYAAELTLKDGVWDAQIRAATTPHGAYELHNRFRIEASP